MKSWNGAVNSFVAATERSTWASPSTSRRTFMPASWVGSLMRAPGDRGRGRRRLRSTPRLRVRAQRPVDEDARRAEVALHPRGVRGHPRRVDLEPVEQLAQ